MAGFPLFSPACFVLWEPILSAITLRRARRSQQAARTPRPSGKYRKPLNRAAGKHLPSLVSWRWLLMSFLVLPLHLLIHLLCVSRARGRRPYRQVLGAGTRIVERLGVGEMAMDVKSIVLTHIWRHHPDIINIRSQTIQKSYLKVSGLQLYILYLFGNKIIKIISP